MKKIQSWRHSGLVRNPTLAMAAMAVFALSANVAQATPVNPAAPEVASWHMGAGVLVLLVAEFVRRVMAVSKTVQGSN